MGISIQSSASSLAVLLLASISPSPISSVFTCECQQWFRVFRHFLCLVDFKQVNFDSFHAPVRIISIFQSNNSSTQDLQQVHLIRSLVAFVSLSTSVRISALKSVWTPQHFIQCHLTVIYTHMEELRQCWRIHI
jgi:hypothetical protein